MNKQELLAHLQALTHYHDEQAETWENMQINFASIHTEMRHDNNARIHRQYAQTAREATEALRTLFAATILLP